MAPRRLDSPAWWRWYRRYLQSPEWEERRFKVLARAHQRCEGCGRAIATQVHHLSYAHVGQEFLWELVAVCEDCHRRCHPRRLSRGLSDPLPPEGTGGGREA